MAETFKRQKTVVIGGGPVGALAALYAAQRGHEVELYELRSDLRDPSTTPLNFTKSINLALSERGINAMRHAERPDLLEKVLSASTPMSGRMIHLKDKSGNFIEQSQEYDVHGRSLYAIDRGGLNGALLNELETLPNVKLFFNHKMTGADFKDHKAWFEIINPATKRIPGSRHREIEISFDFLIGADGAHSAARYHLMKYTRMNYLQEYINMLWCEFTIPAKTGDSEDPDSRFRISPHHLHIWPGHELMFIAIPSIDGSFTCTLFQPAAQFAALEKDPQSVPEFFDSHFPGVTSLIDPSDLVSHFKSNPHLPLISIKCHPYHYTDAAVIVGDAAHAMVPFYGQGMNAGLEDIRVLFSILDAHITAPPSASPALIASQRAAALAAYSSTRKEDAHAINDLALQNYTEMSSSVVSRSYKLRKWLEEALSVYVPSLGWQTKYSRVSFENEPYAEVIRRSERQGRLLGYWLVGLVSSPVMIGGLAMWWRWGNRLGVIRGT